MTALLAPCLMHCLISSVNCTLALDKLAVYPTMS